MATGGSEKKLRIYDLSRVESGGDASMPQVTSRTGGMGNDAGPSAACYEIGQGYHGGTIKSIIWNSDSNILTTACEDRKIRWWDLRTQRPIVEHQVDGPIGTCELDHLADDAGILSIAAGKAVYFFEGSTPGLLYKRVDLDYEVASVAVNKSINRFVTGATNDTWARVHDLSTHEEIGRSKQSSMFIIIYLSLLSDTNQHCRSR